MSAHPRRIVFRFELGGTTGWGHLARCSALAAELRDRGWECVVWSDGRLDAVPEDLREPFSTLIPAGPAWAEQPPAAVRGAEWIAVDYYGAADDVLRVVRAAAPNARLLVLDDEARRTLDAADVVLNSRLGLMESPYAAGARALLGARYALLRHGLRAPAGISSSFAADRLPVLVMLGGTDPRGLTSVVLDALSDMDAPRITPVVVRSRTLPDGDTLARSLRRFPESVWIERVDASALAGWASICGYAVSACGGAVYELAFLGVPFVGIVVAENQHALAAEVAQRWRFPVIDAERGDVCATVSSAMRRLMAEHPVSTSLRSSIGGIDSEGAARVASALEEMSR